MDPTQPRQQAAQQSGLAIASLVCGVISFFFGIFSAIPAVITGHMALTELKKWPGKFDQSSRGMAIAGLIMGYIFIGLTILGVILIVVLVIFVSAAK